MNTWEFSPLNVNAGKEITTMKAYTFTVSDKVPRPVGVLQQEAWMRTERYSFSLPRFEAVVSEVALEALPAKRFKEGAGRP